MKLTQLSHKGAWLPLMAFVARKSKKWMYLTERKRGRGEDRKREREREIKVRVEMHLGWSRVFLQFVCEHSFVDHPVSAVVF